MASRLRMDFDQVKRYRATSIDVVIRLSQQGGVRGMTEIRLPRSDSNKPNA